MGGGKFHSADIREHSVAESRTNAHDLNVLQIQTLKHQPTCNGQQ
jgi:hypothetical protein